MKKLTILATAIAVMAGTVYSEIIIRNYGTEYPTSDGEFVRSSAGTTGESASTSDRQGLPSRIINSPANGRCTYDGEITTKQSNKAFMQGFIIRANMYAAGVSDAVDWAIMLDYNDVTHDKRIALQFGSDSNGYTIVKVGIGTNGGSYTNTSATAFNEYELRYDTVASNVDLFVDNIEVLSDIGFGSSFGTENLLRWGSNSYGDSGASHWNLVEFEVVPAHSTLALILMGVVFLPVFAIRRSRT